MRLKLSLDRRGKIGTQIGRLNFGIRQDVDQHRGMGRELRMDHARSLTEGRDPNFAHLTIALRSSLANAVFSTVSVVRMAVAASWNLLRLQSRSILQGQAARSKAFLPAAGRR